MSEGCIFCRIVNREIPATVVGETPDALAFRDVNPQAPTHVLVVPKRHVASLDQLDDQTVGGSLLAFAASLARELGVSEAGYRIAINTNADGGQTVHHLHLHLLAGRRLTWPPG